MTLRGVAQFFVGACGLVAFGAGAFIAFDGSSAVLLLAFGLALVVTALVDERWERLRVRWGSAELDVNLTEVANRTSDVLKQLDHDDENLSDARDWKEHVEQARQEVEELAAAVSRATGIGFRVAEIAATVLSSGIEVVVRGQSFSPEGLVWVAVHGPSGRQRQHLPPVALAPVGQREVPFVYRPETLVAGRYRLDVMQQIDGSNTTLASETVQVR